MNPYPVHNRDLKYPLSVKRFFETVVNKTAHRLVGKNILVIGRFHDILQELLRERGYSVTSLYVSPDAKNQDQLNNLAELKDKYNGMYLVDILQHVMFSEEAIAGIFSRLQSGGILVALTSVALESSKKTIYLFLKKSGFLDAYFLDIKKDCAISADFFPSGQNTILVCARKPGPTSRITVAEGYFRRYGPSMALWRTEELNTVEVDLPSPALDLGCGDGYTSTFLKKAPGIGMDINLPDLKNARENNRYKLLIRGDARDLPFNSLSFNSVFSNCAIEHIPGPPVYLKEIERILKQGGIFIFSVPTEYFRLWLPGTERLDRLKLHKIAESIRNIFSFLMKHYTEKNIDWWSSKLQEAGFEVSETRPFLNKKRYRTLVFFLPLRIGYLFFPKITSLIMKLIPFSSVLIKSLAGKDIERQIAATEGSCRSGEQTKKTCTKKKLLQCNSIDYGTGDFAGLIIIARKK